MKQIIAILNALFLIAPMICLSQSPFGRVLDAKTRKPIKNATVMVEGKDLETKTNIGGYFQVTADSTQNIIIVHEEYEPVQFKMPARELFLVKLVPYDTPGYESGMVEFYSFFARELKYPRQARRMGFEGMIYVSFDIDSLNGMQNIITLHDPSGPLRVADDVINVLRRLPNKWIPHTRIATMILPVKFWLVRRDPLRPEKFRIPPGKLLKEIIVEAFR